MYEIRLITEGRAELLPLLGLPADPGDGALYVMREHGFDQCAALVTVSEDGCTLAAFGQHENAAAENAGVLLEWVYYKAGQQFGEIAGAASLGAEFLQGNGFVRGEDGAWTRKLTPGCKCAQSE